ncbi:hypothetical protein BaRGS_00033461 [Batillaria attramentaria]|uniref:Uncharacterized protein n=1 Tax=Batillaria attramentaria TaxID=370345 RepID=A0ABD0JKG2_9CAEN
MTAKARFGIVHQYRRSAVHLNIHQQNKTYLSSSRQNLSTRVPEYTHKTHVTQPDKLDNFHAIGSKPRHNSRAKTVAKGNSFSTIHAKNVIGDTWVDGVLTADVDQS